MVKKNTIPDGWRNVQPVGQPIPGTRFIAFKVPLKGVINHRLTPTQKFTPKDLIAAMKMLNVELGLIIDLTYTTRYYDVKDLPKSLEYKKLFTVGHEVPDDATILQFKKWVRKFLWENADNEKLIGVHCTNGINRTGYLICRYLIDVEGWEPGTAIQAFGEARGHHMDGNIYLIDLRTQPMRSNLGMNLWDADGDVVPTQNDIDGHLDRFPNEEFPRTGKRLRVYEDNHNDSPEQIGLREFDFINKGPGQRRKPYHDHGFQGDLEPLVQIRQRHFPEHSFYDECQEEMPLKDLEFTARGSRKRLRPCHGRQLCDDDFSMGAPPGDIDMGHRERQSHFPAVPPHNDRLRDSQLRRGQRQQQRSFYDLQSNDDCASEQLFPNMPLKDLALPRKRPGPRARPFLDSSQCDDMQLPMGDFEFVSRAHGQRMRPFSDHQHHSDLQREISVDDFEERDSESRCRPFHDHQSYDEDFLNGRPGSRMRSFIDHSPSEKNMAYADYVERNHPFVSHEHFPDSSILHRDYGSDKDGYQGNSRSDCPEDYRRMYPANEINREITRFSPYSSHPVHHPSSSQQEFKSISVDHGTESQCEITRAIGQGKRLPVVTIDYNYGLPLDYTSEEDRAHYDLHTREHCVWE
ncbi:hypothetical protein JRQ81_017146 [Phrynocephalus forsythii]|uniref:RNA/RNP complex-1-interacting phosphatase n=1 Tax=Phrynocephalus forsythii TaxID=171643 RepID=A0A9Q0XPT5_9SAUR|nr:hypothetical protein JRQ81_017146 [Phrynocephalus forsythii]